MSRIILTGGPGAGKTSIVEELEKLGHIVVTEPARTLISHYKIHSPELLPELSKENRKKFQVAIEATAIGDYNNNTHGFFDRSIIDEIGYRYRYGIKITDELHSFVKENKYDAVFFFPFWKEIYKNDDVRHENPTEAKLVSKHIFQAYLNYGYDPYIVPKLSIKLRMEYILNNIKHLI